jgi:DNA-binding beta-propeller fold protein YncE
MLRRTHIAAAALLAAAACAHAGPPAGKALPEVAWPAAPAAPRLRLVAVLPPPDAPAPKRSLWQRVVDAVVGADPAEEDDRRLVRPFGVAASEDGAVFVADPDLPGVLRVGPEGGLEPVACRDRAWSAPMAVAVGGGGELWVADGGAAEVVVVPPDHRCRAIGAGQLERPTGVALAAGRVVVADPPRHQLVVFSTDGALIARWGSEGEGDDQLHFPTAVATAGEGVLAVDALNFRVVRVSPDGHGAPALGARGDEGGALARPKCVAVDPSGRVYVSDAQRDLVLVYDARGAFEYAAGASGAEPGAFQHPAGVAVLRDRLYVADSHNARIQVFQILGGSS